MRRLTPQVDALNKICNGILQNGAGLLSHCAFPDFPFFTCVMFCTFICMYPKYIHNTMFLFWYLIWMSLSIWMSQESMSRELCEQCCVIFIKQSKYTLNCHSWYVGYLDEVKSALETLQRRLNHTSTLVSTVSTSVLLMVRGNGKRCLEVSSSCFSAFYIGDFLAPSGYLA